VLGALFLCAPAAFASSVSVSNIAPASGVSAGTTITFYASANGFVNPTYAVSGGGKIDQYGYFSWTPTVDDAGSHTITVTASDSQGDTASTNVTLYVIPDTITIENLSPGVVAYTREPVTFTVHTPGFTSPVFTLRDAYAGTTASASDIDPSTGAFSWTPATNEQGIHTFTISVLDRYGRSAQVTQTITVLPPTLAVGTVSPGTSVAPGTAVSFAVSSVGLTDPMYTVADSLGYHSSVSAASIASTTGAFSWTPTADDIGTHVLTVTGRDANGSTASAKVTITVSATPASAATTNSATNAASEATVAPAPASAPSAAGAAQDGYVFTTYLRVGSTGAAVTELQKHLTLDGSYSGPVTGYFGPLTQGGVETFQRTHGIVSSGTVWTTGYGGVGPQTRAALNAER
jgi:hypothetical protein